MKCARPAIPARWPPRMIWIFSEQILFCNFAQKADAPVERAMAGAEEVPKARRIYVVIHKERIEPVRHVVDSNARCPAVSMKRKLALNSRVHGKEIRQAELAWS